MKSKLTKKLNKWSQKQNDQITILKSQEFQNCGQTLAYQNVLDANHFEEIKKIQLYDL